MLDLNILYPLVYPQPVRYLDVYNVLNPSLGDLDDFLDAIDPSYCTSPGAKNEVDPHFPNKYWNHSLECGLYQPPNVISISYSICQEYLKLGLQGVSLVAASGDRGTFPSTGSCTPKNTHPTGLESPAECPYVLSVGATKLGKTASDPQEAAYDLMIYGYYTYGGGFSTLFPRPSYQNAAVEHFFNVSTVLPPSIAYNYSNRAIPDVSAVGQNIATYDGPTHYKHGKPTGALNVSKSDGTSASAPLVAALISRINGMRLEAGKKTLGFVNPVFYAYPEMFTDITKGHNNGCPFNDSSNHPTPAFYCVKGWDPVTGLGIPNFPKMVEVLTALK